jgi:serine/threonine protein kinase
MVHDPTDADTMRSPGDFQGRPPAKSTFLADQVGPYKLLRVLGRGGMGVVYEAESSAHPGRVALKVLTALRIEDQVMQRRFQREAAIASRLDHPGICPVLDAGIAEGVPFIAMPILKGHPLDTWLKEHTGVLKTEHTPLDSSGGADASQTLEIARTMAIGPMSLAQVVRMILEALRALHFAHESGVIHRDLKPANLFFCDDGHVRILDFGLARDSMEVAPTLTLSGDVFGTPAYMSPEQIEGQRNVDRCTDIWSMGVTLFELLTFQRPFRAPTHAALFEAIRMQATPDARRINPAIDAGLHAVLSVALAKDPKSRYPTANAFAKDLERWASGQRVLARKPTSWDRLTYWAR